jgi:hypothetical protein
MDPRYSDRPAYAQYFQLPSVSDNEVWLAGFEASQVDTVDKRVFFKITETGQLGYLFDGGGTNSVEEIKIQENMLGEIRIKLDQIKSITVDQSEITIQTRDSGVRTGILKDDSNFSHVFGPHLITTDAEIALFRPIGTNKVTLNRIEAASPSLIHPQIYWDRSQLKFRNTSTGEVGYFNELVHQGHIQFTEQSLGCMRICVPQIKRLTVNIDNKDAPVVIETFAGNAYQGVCPELFNLSDTTISFDKVKNNLVLEAFDRQTPSV